MWHVGIDLHRLTVVIAAVNDEGNSSEVRRINCQDRQVILETMRALQPFRAVIEATGTYRWLYDLLAPLGTVLLAHPLRLRAMVQRRSKTDKLDSQLLANLLRINQIPLAYIPPEHYQQLRDVTRHRARLSRQAATAKIRAINDVVVHDEFVPEERTFSFQDPQLIKRRGGALRIPVFVYCKGCSTGTRHRSPCDRRPRRERCG